MLLYSLFILSLIIAIESLDKEKTLISNRNKFKKLLEKYQDSEFLIEKVKSNVEKIKSEKTLIDYIQLTTESNLDTSTKTQLVKIYSDRLNNFQS